MGAERHLGMPEEDSRRGVVEPRCVTDPRSAAGPSAGGRSPGSGGTAAARSRDCAGDRLGMRECTCTPNDTC